MHYICLYIVSYINIFLAFTASQEVDVAVLQHLRSMIDKQRDQIRARDKEMLQKNMEIENVNWYLCSYVICGNINCDQVLLM